MKFSIITPSYNSAKTISDTINSIINQTHKDLEYIIIDGLSRDNTVDIVRKYQDNNQIKLVSEKDAGIYDAMNKGVKMTTGDIVGILNSDDFYYNDDVLNKVNKVFESDDSIDAVYGDLVYVDQDDITKQTRYWRSGEYNEKNINWGWIMPHPTVFIRKRVYDHSDKIFDTQFSIAADYELLLRLLKVNKIKVHYLPERITKMRAGGTSGRDLKHRIRGWKELRLAWTVNHLRVPSLFIVRRVLGKVGQFLSRPQAK